MAGTVRGGGGVLIRVCARHVQVAEEEEEGGIEAEEEKEGGIEEDACHRVLYYSLLP